MNLLYLFKPNENDSKGIYFKKHKPTRSRKLKRKKQQHCFGGWKADEQVVTDLAKLRVSSNLAEKKARKQPGSHHRTPKCSVIGSARKS